ncbi:hypothetical protein BBJ28_00017587 [Nothophytophthora sp. Chile5]|nr:hypothetical protein BBJ28_00017587 [Nothophytophthora sp. Chile5]
MTSSSRGRNGGLFSSSSSSSGDSGGSDEEREGEQRAPVAVGPTLLTSSARSRSVNAHSNQPSGDMRRRTMFLSSSLGAANSGGDVLHAPERRGLFENDDDTADSMETFHERVKLRQTRKQSELKALEAQLEVAQQRSEALESQLARETKEKDEFAIRTKECQRIIEKRNKQLMKASERMARHSEQFELQTAELQARLAALTVQCDQLRVDAATKEELDRRERELKEQEQQRELETRTRQHEKLIEAAEHRVRVQQAENTTLAKKLRELERQLSSTAERKPTSVQILASDEYQGLLKRSEDAEAIGRGLKFQLEKEQQEKKYLRKQLTALQATVGPTKAAATAASVGFLPEVISSEAGSDVVSPSNSAVAAAAADADLASFDFSASKDSAPPSPVAAAAPGSPSSQGTASSRNRSRSRGFSASSITEEPPRAARREGKRRSASVQSMTAPAEPSEEKPADDKTTAGSGKSIASSVTFFEKLSSKFKRSSPRNSLNTPKSEEDSAATDGAAPSEAVFASPLPPRRAFAHSKVLHERPRMYVAKPPSHHEEESSDSIFGSESSSSDSSDEDGGEVPPPPPPPMAAPFVPAPAVHVEIPSQLVPSDASADADSSSLSDSDDSEDEKLTQEKRGRSERPAPLPTERARFADPLESRGRTTKRTVRVTSPPSRVSSVSDSSGGDSDDSDIETKTPLNVDATKVASPSESSSSSDSSSSSEEDDAGSDAKTKTRRKSQRGTEDGHKRHRVKRSSRSPSLPRAREKSHSVGGLESSHNTSKSRMNEYMEARAKKRNEKLKRKQDKENEETKKKEEYEKEWEKMAQEERERKRKQQQTRRNGRRRPASMKTVRVSQMRQQMNSKQQQKDPQVPSVPEQQDQPRPRTDEAAEPEGPSHRPSQRKSGSKTSGSEDSEEDERPRVRVASADTPPLPPEPTAADTELYLRQQARLRERHDMQMKKKLEADEADLVRGDIHRRVEMWAFGKELLHMILTLDQISSSDALKKCQLMVVQSPDNDTVRKAYRYVLSNRFGCLYRALYCMLTVFCVLIATRNIIRVIHPDKLRGATIPEQLEAKELFTVLNQAFDKFKEQAS